MAPAVYRPAAEKERFLRSPVRGTRFAYHVHAFSILASEPRLPTWVHRVDLPEGLGEHERKIWARVIEKHGPVVEAREAAADDRLALLGFSGDQLARPEVADLRADLIRLSQFADQAFDAVHGLSDETPQLPFSPPYDRSICRDVIVAARIGLGEPSPKAIASHLNAMTGGGRAAVSEGLSQDHVARALKSDTARLVKLAPRGRNEVNGFLEIIARRQIALAQQFRALEFIAEQAALRPELRALRGADLATSIDDKFGLGTCADRAFVRLYHEPAVAA